MHPQRRQDRSASTQCTRRVLVGLALVLAASGCAPERANPTRPRSSGPIARAREAGPPRLARALRVQEESGDLLLDLDGVAGSGVGVSDDGRAVIRLFVTRTGLRLPSRIGGVPVEQEVTGEIRPFSLTGRFRPLAMGVSTGNLNDCVPGTIGAVLGRAGHRYLLSCNHVFARQNLAAIGETIVQPSRPDGSADCAPNPADAVARLADFEPLDFSGGDNFFDAAIAEVSGGVPAAVCETPPGFYGSPGSLPVAGSLGLAIMKVGRTTELTRGQVKSVDVKVKITYPGGVAKFKGVMETSKLFGAFGDSGSLVVTDDESHSPVGLVFSGDNQGRAFICPIEPILARFGLELCAP